MKDRIRVLYIDDYELDRELVKDALEKEHGGFEVTEAPDKQVFMEVLKTCEFDVVLSDFNIAGFEGLQVLDAVHRFNPDLPVIIVTGTGSEEIAVMALKQGAADYVIKRAKHILKLPQTIFAVMEKQALISQGRKGEIALRSALQRLAFHVENSPLAVVEFDKEFRITHWSKKAEHVFGWHADEVLGKGIDQFRWVHEGDAQRVAKLSSDMFASHRTSNIHTNRNYRKDGSIIICEWYNSALIDDTGNLVSVQSLVLDITERKRLEDDLLRAQKLESVGILAGGIAHDFNNILTTIVGNVSMAKMQVPPEDDMYDLLRDVEVAALRAKTLTLQLLTFAKGGSPVKETASITDILKENASFVLRGSKSRCEFSMEEDLWPVDIDVGQISQVLNNILINANHAMPSGGGHADFRRQLSG